MRRSLAALALCLLALSLAAPPAAAQSEAPAELLPVDIELVLMADATGSIDDAEIRFQRQGYADALRDPLLVDAMTAGPYGRVALVYVEWADADSQEVVAGWTVIDGPAAAAAFADELMSTPRRAYGRNAIGAALRAGAQLIESNAYAGDRKIIDFAGDSANNWDGISISYGRRIALDAGITINGLAMLCRSEGCSGRPVSYDLEFAFTRDIIGGPGAFVITADSPATFGDAVRRKLFLEVSGREPPARLAAVEE